MLVVPLPDDPGEVLGRFRLRPAAPLATRAEALAHGEQLGLGRLRHAHASSRLRCPDRRKRYGALFAATVPNQTG